MNPSNPLFTNRQLYRLIWPLMIEQLLNVLVGMIDVVMVASIGEAAVSGVSLVDSMNQLLIQFLAALTAGGTVVCSQYIGMKDSEKASKAAGQMIGLTVAGCAVIVVALLFGGRQLLGLIFGRVEPDVMDNAYRYFLITTFSFPFLALYNSCASIYRANSNSQIPMRASLFMNGLNLVGNAICIYGLGMGVEGVAIPTLIARAASALLLFMLIQQPKNEVRLRSVPDLIPRWSVVRRILAIGIPGGMESGMFQFGKLTLQSLVTTLGTHAIAGFATAFSLVTFLYLPGNALGLAVTTVVGQCVGAGEAEQARRYTWKLIAVDYALLAVIATGEALIRDLWISIYNLSPEASAMASGLVLSHCIAMVIWPLAFLMPYALRASNDAKFTMFIAIFSMWVFRVVLAYFFVGHLHLGILFVWIAMYIDWVFRTIVFLLRFRGFTGRIKKLHLA